MTNPKTPTGLPYQEYIGTSLTYDEFTGQLFWKIRPLSHFKNLHGMNTFNSIYAGHAAGHENERGYVSIRLMGKAYLAHRIIWKLVTGQDPDALIDHRDEDKKNNAWANLRQATVQQNGFNRGCSAANKTGFKGVTWDRSREKFFASICNNGKTKALGRFETAELAYAAYQAAAKLVHGDFMTMSGCTNLGEKA
jgi:hypothetical protein